MHGCCVVFCIVIVVVLRAWLPKYSELSLCFAVSQPMVPHVLCFRTFLVYIIEDESRGRRIVGFEWGGQLGLVERF